MDSNRVARRARNRAKRSRQRAAAAETRLMAARVRIGPDPSTRVVDESSLTRRPFEKMVADYRETPVSWRDVWGE